MEYRPESIPQPENDTVVSLRCPEYERMNSLLDNTIEQLDLISQPDHYVQKVRGVQFGRYGDSYLSMEHTNDDNFHEGIIIYTDKDNVDRSFSISNTYRNAQGWHNNEKKYSAKSVLQQLERNWPMSDTADDDSMLSRLRAQINSDEVIDPAYVFDVIQEYSERSSSGYRDYEKLWTYHDTSYNTATGDARVESVMVTDSGSTENGEHEISVSIIVPYDVDGCVTPLTCTLRRDAFEDILLETCYLDIDSETNQPIHVPIAVKNPDGVYGEIESALTAMLKEKSTGVSEVRP